MKIGVMDEIITGITCLSSCWLFVSYLESYYVVAKPPLPQIVIID
jgi:hypothetical protein